jgi:hypothetical protein
MQDAMRHAAKTKGAISRKLRYRRKSTDFAIGCSRREKLCAVRRWGDNLAALFDLVALSPFDFAAANLVPLDLRIRLQVA